MTEENKSSPEINALALARSTGLDKAALQFPEDVEVAVRTAMQARASLSAPDDPAAEPWPPMQMRIRT
jgi:hypothetical protein